VSERITFAQSDLLPEGSGPFDLVCANLPYIPCKTLRGLPVSRYEPSLALDGGEDGLEVIRRLLRIAPGCLDPGGALLVEIEAGQGKKTAELAKASFPAGQVAVIPDLAGRDRLVVVQNEGG
jgi:release factor glutamine methyltransferase